jgi:hypothetical protein
VVEWTALQPRAAFLLQLLMVQILTHYSEGAPVFAWTCERVISIHITHTYIYIYVCMHTCIRALTAAQRRSSARLSGSAASRSCTRCRRVLLSSLSTMYATLRSAWAPVSAAVCAVCCGNRPLYLSACLSLSVSLSLSLSLSLSFSFSLFLSAWCEQSPLSHSPRTQANSVS